MAGVQVPADHNLTITQEWSSRVIHGSGGQISGTEERVVTRLASPTTHPPAVVVTEPRINYWPAWANKPGVVLVYDGKSIVTLTHRGQQVPELQSLAEKVNFYVQCCRNATVREFQPTRDTGGTLVTVGGEVQIPGEHQARPFDQVFILMPTPEGSYYVQNDIFCIPG